MGQNREIRVKSGGLVEIYSIYICFDSKFSQEFKFNIFQGQLGSSEVKLGSNPSDGGQIGRISRNIFNIHMFRLKIFSRIQILYFRGQLGSSEIKLGSNPSNRGQIGPVGRNISTIHMFRLKIEN